MEKFEPDQGQLTIPKPHYKISNHSAKVLILNIKVKHLINRIRQQLQSLRHKAVWLSLGENCLPDDILRRHGKKIFSSPYSNGRTNIDYALALESENYKNLISPAYLVRGEAFGQGVVRSTHYQCAPIFDASCSAGFEFSHHDPLGSTDDRASFQRKIDRLLKIRGQESVVFLYHHRWTERSDLPRLREKLQQFARFYTAPGVRCVMVLFYQNLTAPKETSYLTEWPVTGDQMEFTFHTRDYWMGTDQEIFWARNDDALIVSMLEKVEQHLNDK
ncbi:MAG: DUF1796 family putative cysteine peptidase [Dechloromonas sp.]|nr:DUF1796 family putative cysteine peptidase [Dechloromonas sp.]